MHPKEDNSNSQSDQLTKPMNYQEMSILTLSHNVNEHMNSRIGNSSFQPNIDDDRKNYSD